MTSSKEQFRAPALLYRDLHQRYIRDPRLGHRLGRSFESGVHADETWGTPWLGTNSNGFYGQDETFSERKPVGTCRIMLLGGSAAMGLGASARPLVLANQMAATLKRQGLPVEVLNCAVGDYSSSQALLYFLTEMMTFSPDIVVLLDGFNDFSHSTWGTKFGDGAWLPNTTRSFDDGLFAVLDWDQSLPKSIRKEVNRRWRPGAVRREKRRRRKKGRQIVDTHGAIGLVWDDPENWFVKSEAIEWYLRNVTSFSGVCSEYGMRFLQVVQPSMLWPEANTRSKEEKDLLALFDSRMPRIRELATAYFGELETAFATKWGQNLDGRLADPDARSYFCSGAEWLLSRDSSMYSDPIHWNDEGQGVIARELCNVLVDRLAWIKQ